MSDPTYTRAQIADIQTLAHAFRDAFNAGVTTLNSGAAAQMNALAAKGYSIPTLPALIAAYNQNTVAPLTTWSGMIHAFVTWADALVPSDPLPVAQRVALYDGMTGVSRDYWNYGAALPWPAPGAYSKGVRLATLTAVAGYSGDVTAAVQAAIADGNPGFLLQPDNDGSIGGRGHPQAPTLIVDGVACVLLAANVLSSGNAFPLPLGDDQVLRSSAPNPIAIYFALPAACTSATMSITHEQFSATNYGVFLLNPPTVITDFPMPDASLQVDLSKRTDLIVAADWQADMSAVLPEGQMATDTVFLPVDPQVGRAATFHFAPGQYEPVALMRRHSTLGIPHLDEAYVGFWMRLEDDGTTLQGQKIGMGISGRGGAPTLAGGRLNPVCGNGGSSCDGTFHVPQPGNVDANVAAGYTCGWSMRPWLAPRIIDVANPMALYRSLQTYAYWALMPVAQTPFGQNFIWSGVAIQKGRWYWIEQYIKLNTVVGADANGNGTGQNDGVYRVSINGRAVDVLDYSTHLPITNWCFTHNAAIALDELPWVDFYEGGTLDPTTQSRVSLGSFVVAKAPIGVPSAPPVEAQPDPPPIIISGGSVSNSAPLWLRGKPRMTWLQIAGSAMQNATVVLSQLLGMGFGDATLYGRPEMGIMNYSGGCLISPTELAVSGGGGAGAWAGNDWRGFDVGVDNPAWRLVFAPSLPATVPARGSNTVWTYADGAPTAEHSYWGLGWFNGCAYYLKQQNGWAYDGGHTFDVWKRSAAGWTKVATLGGQQGWDGPWCVQDARTGRFYIGAQFTIEWFDPRDNSVGTFWTDPQNWGSIDRAAAACNNGVLLRIGYWGGSTDWTGALQYNLDAGSWASLTATGGIQGQVGLDNWYKGASLEYDDALKSWVSWDDTTLRSYVQQGTSMVGTDMVIAGTPPDSRHSFATHGEGVRGRHRFIRGPNFAGHLIVQAYDRDAYFVATE